MKMPSFDSHRQTQMLMPIGIFSSYFFNDGTCGHVNGSKALTVGMADLFPLRECVKVFK